MALALAVCGVGGWQYNENRKLGEAREAAISELAASVDLANYREAEQNEINGMIEAAEAKINESKDEDEIKGIVSETTGGFATVKTKAQYVKDEGVKELNNLVDTADYREAEQAEIKEILSGAEAKIKDAKGEDEVASLVKEASESLAALKTDAQYSEEEAAAAAAAAKKKSSKKKKSSSQQGCIGGGSDAFY